MCITHTVEHNYISPSSTVGIQLHVSALYVGQLTWDIINKLSNNQQPQTDIQELIIDTKHLKDQQDIADTFNNYFSTIIDKISINNTNNKTDKKNFPTFQHYPWL